MDAGDDALDEPFGDGEEAETARASVMLWATVKALMI